MMNNIGNQVSRAVTGAIKDVSDKIQGMSKKIHSAALPKKSTVQDEMNKSDNHSETTQSKPASAPARPTHSAPARTMQSTPTSDAPKSTSNTMGDIRKLATEHAQNPSEMESKLDNIARKIQGQNSPEIDSVLARLNEGLTEINAKNHPQHDNLILMTLNDTLEQIIQFSKPGTDAKQSTPTTASTTATGATNSTSTTEAMESLRKLATKHTTDQPTDSTSRGINRVLNGITAKVEGKNSPEVNSLLAKYNEDIKSFNILFNDSASGPSGDKEGINGMILVTLNELSDNLRRL